ncbi:MAG TPA: hypothetical protein VER58_19270 [Thermoanaerobaculia bacterium]|nr:hypothetical protein [Thermoanaerobaculia bacterium]
MRLRLRTPAGRAITISVIFASLYNFAEPSNYLYALEVHRQRVERVREIAKNLNIDPEFLLHPDRPRVLPQSSAATGLTQVPLNINDAVVTGEVEVCPGRR